MMKMMKIMVLLLSSLL